MAVDEVIAQIETDKVTMDVRAPAAGVIDSIKARPRLWRHVPLRRTARRVASLTRAPPPCEQVAKGDNVKVGQLVATFTEGAAGAAAPKAAKAAKAAAPAAPAAAGGAPTRIEVPSMGACALHARAARSRQC